MTEPDWKLLGPDDSGWCDVYYGTTYMYGYCESDVPGAADILLGFLDRLTDWGVRYDHGI